MLKCSSASSLSDRRERSTLLKSMLDTSSNTLVAMASELSEVQDRQSFSGPGFLQHLQSMQDAKTLLQYMFSIVVDARLYIVHLLCFGVAHDPCIAFINI
mgnify:FL=1